jgi:hypothetical protein
MHVVLLSPSHFIIISQLLGKAAEVNGFFYYFWEIFQMFFYSKIGQIAL